jgi:hypothetical protein
LALPLAATLQQLPPGITLPDASNPQQMELQLSRLMRCVLQLLLPVGQYDMLLDQLREAFNPLRLSAAVDPGQQQQLEMMYAYVQAAVRMGRVDRVVGAIRSLVAAACSIGRGMVVD